MTTLPLAQWPTALVIELYACRWHIEVLFKRIKQVLDLHTLRCETPETTQAMIAARLFAWLLIEEDLEGLRRQLADGEPFAVALSSWRLAHLAFEGLQQVVKGWYSRQQLREALPEFRRLFRERRQRPLLEHQRRLRFHSLLALDADLPRDTQRDESKQAIRGATTFSRRRKTAKCRGKKRSRAI